MTYTPAGPVWVPGMGEQPKPSILIPSNDPQSGLIKTWSVSALEMFKKCPHASFLKSVTKVKQERKAASDRGIKLHDAAEEYVKGNTKKLTAEFKGFRQNVEDLRNKYKEGKVELEGDWAFDSNWEPTEWYGKNVWGRIKLDAFEKQSDTAAKVIDYKSGKKFGNELKHSFQLLVYAIGAFIRHPKLEYIDASCWYIDQKDEVLDKSFSRGKAMIFMPRLEQQALKLTTCTDFPPRPSQSNCLYCPFKETCEWRYDA